MNPKNLKMILITLVAVGILSAATYAGFIYVAAQKLGTFVEDIADKFKPREKVTAIEWWDGND